MKIKILMVAASMMMFAACGGDTPAATDEMPAEQATVINTTDPYVCPMNCENSGSMEAGVCKTCGMELVKNANYAGTSSDSTSTMSGDTASGVMEGHEQSH